MRDAANRRSSVSSRRLWEAHSSMVADSHDHALDATIVTVAKASRGQSSRVNGSSRGALSPGTPGCR
jgi:hypothetical protein